MEKALEGVKVVELGIYGTAPWCGRLLADMGAEVIKIEAPNGDPHREFGKFANAPSTDDENPCYLMMNSGKRDICLNLKTEEGRQILFDMLKDANIFFTNTRIEGLKRMGLTYDDLKDKFPHLIYGHISGYGMNGPDAKLPGFDSTAYFARVGALVDGAYEGMGPAGIVYGVGDNTTGTCLALGLVSALYKQAKTGEGDYVLVSLYGTALSIYSVSVITTQDGEGYTEKYPKDWNHPATPVCTTYMCPGGAINLGLLTHEKFWPGFCRAIEREDLIDDPRFATRDAISSLESTEIMVPMLKEIFAQHDIDYWIKALSENDIPFGSARHFKDCFNDQTAWDNGYLGKFTYPNGHVGNVIATPIHFKEFKPDPVILPAPLKGENTREILRELGYSEEQIETLELKKIALSV